jgi:site-specific DNA-methyltransferase (adenine-specific)
MKTTNLPLEKLIAYAGNPRRNDHAVEAVAAAIKRFGFRVPVLAKSDGSLIDGHLRIKAAKRLGMTEVPVALCDDLSEAEIKALRISINRMAELAEWDEELLMAELEGLAAEGITMDDVGFDLDALEALGASVEPEGNPEADAEPQIDKAEELRAKWGVEPGQLWQLGDHRLLCGDSCLKKSTEVLMGGGLADMVITDPPYGVAYVGKTKDALKVENDDVDEKTLAEMCKDWFDRADEVSRDGAYWVATVPAGPLHGVFFFDWKQRGILRQVMVWNKDSMVLGHSEYHYKHEPILFGWKPGDRLKNADRTKTTVWDFPRPKVSREHPTMKPVEMWCYAIGNHTRPKDTVYEPFSGSGTTIIACEQLGRKARAIEISPAYVAVALQRWADATGKTPRLVP